MSLIESHSIAATINIVGSTDTHFVGHQHNNGHEEIFMMRKQPGWELAADMPEYKKPSRKLKCRCQIYFFMRTVDKQLKKEREYYQKQMKYPMPKKDGKTRTNRKP